MNGEELCGVIDRPTQSCGPQLQHSYAGQGAQPIAPARALGERSLLAKNERELLTGSAIILRALPLIGS